MEGGLDLNKMIKFTEEAQQLTDCIDRQAKRPNVSLSSIDQTHLDELLNHLQFRRAMKQHAKDVKGDYDQVCKRGYMSYLSDNISIPSKFICYDLKPKKDLLNINDSSLPYSITNSRDALAIIEMALAKGPKDKATTDINFPIRMRCNYFRRLQYGEAFENKVEGLDLFLNRPKINFEFKDDIAN
ncbi:18259_t:CDS:2, partial [Racocetra fulgida]